MIQDIRSKANIVDVVLAGIRTQWPGGRSSGCMAARLLGTAVSNPSGTWSVVCCEVKVSVAGRSLVQMSSTEGGVSKCDREASVMRRP